LRASGGIRPVPRSGEIGGNQSGRTRRALYWRLRVPGHASRWAGCLTDPWHEYASIRSLNASIGPLNQT
jgi:hypothetical protein